MKELDFLNVINNTLADSSLIGDDCAYLEDFDMYITQDTLVEDVHFSLSNISPYMLGRKSVSVNLSDLAAALCEPKYISISLSLPEMTKSEFVEELYKGINDVCSEYGIKVSGGDITGSNKVIISVCALGKKVSFFSSSRKYAKKNQVIVTTGEFGSSGAAFHALENFLYCDKSLIEKHFNPTPAVKKGLTIAKLTDCDIAATDCSDGLMPALYYIAKESKHDLKIDFDKIPVNNKVKEYCSINKLDYKEFVKWGGEDYELILCIPEELYEKLDKNEFIKIGTVLNKDTSPSVKIKDGTETYTLTKNLFEEKAFNHFKL